MSHTLQQYRTLRTSRRQMRHPTPAGWFFTVYFALLALALWSLT